RSQEPLKRRRRAKRLYAREVCPESHRDRPARRGAADAMTATQRQRVRPRQIGRDRKRQGARGSDRITGREVAVDAKGGLDVVQQLVACLEIAPGGIRRAKRRVQAEVVERFAEAEVQRLRIRRRDYRVKI